LEKGEPRGKVSAKGGRGHRGPGQRGRTKTKRKKNHKANELKGGREKEQPPKKSAGERIQKGSEEVSLIIAKGGREETK